MSHKTLLRTLMLVSALALFGCKPSTSPESTATSGGNAENAPGNAPANAPAPDNSGGTKALMPAPKPIVVPAGTEIVVTADQSVSSKTNNAGDQFAASLAAPVVVGGEEVIPKAAKATGTVTVAKSAGRFKGNAELGVTLSSITVHGRDYQVQTSSVAEATKGRGKRTAVGAGGGAALGAIIGAIAGKGKGAAIGAAAGAGAGTAGAAMTGERDITINAEHKLTFKLKEPLQLRR